VLTGGGKLAYYRFRRREEGSLYWLHLHALRWEKGDIFGSGLGMASVGELHT
jgi:hypothetical protein